jgi:ribosome biogenesis GTPase A
VAKGKRRVIVLNKKDLVSRDYLRASCDALHRMYGDNVHIMGVEAREARTVSTLTTTIARLAPQKFRTVPSSK